MKKINYSQFDLEGFSLKELQRICRYYGIEYKPSWTKERLRKEIFDYSPAHITGKSHNIRAIPEVEIEEGSVITSTEPIKSVRIQRIEERNK